MKFCCASNATIKMSKSQEKNQLFPKIFCKKSLFLQKVQICRKNKIYVRNQGKILTHGRALQ